MPIKWEMAQITWLTPDIFPEKSYGIRVTYRTPAGTRRDSHTATDWSMARYKYDEVICELLAEGWEPLSEIIFKRRWQG